jgi:hypothetical protein
MVNDQCSSCSMKYYAHIRNAILLSLMQSNDAAALEVAESKKETQLQIY